MYMFVLFIVSIMSAVCSEYNVIFSNDNVLCAVWYFLIVVCSFVISLL